MIAPLALTLMQATMTTGAPPLARGVPATDWACEFHRGGGGTFRLSGRIGEIPNGWDPNRSRLVDVAGEGMPALTGKGSATNAEAGEHFRDYQIGVTSGAETYYVNLKLRRGGAGIGYVTRYVSGPDRQPYTYFAAGLCSAQFDVAARSAEQ
jgi:hypothetical protein